MDIGVERNAYGRQLDSRIVQLPKTSGGGAWKRCLSARRSFAVSATGAGACADTTAIRCWSSRAGTWWRRFTRN